MKTSLRTLGLPFAALCLLSATAAHAADTGSFTSNTQIKGDTAGNYQSKTTEDATDTSGTSQSSVTKEKVAVNGSGDTDVSTSTKTVTDPAGLGNKSTAETSEDTKTKADGSSDSKAVTESSTAGGSTDKAVDQKTVKVDSKGHKKVKVTHKKSHDPKGLMNKTTSETTDTTTQKDNGQTETTHETDVNGKATEKTDQVQ